MPGSAGSSHGSFPAPVPNPPTIRSALDARPATPAASSAATATTSTCRPMTPPEAFAEIATCWTALTTSALSCLNGPDVGTTTPRRYGGSGTVVLDGAAMTGPVVGLVIPRITVGAGASVVVVD